MSSLEIYCTVRVADCVTMLMLVYRTDLCMMSDWFTYTIINMRHWDRGASALVASSDAIKSQVATTITTAA
jgi:hypothetical protein